jgi:WD40 repeat protein
VTYEDDIFPVLKNSCLNCHNPDKKKAGLDLSTYSALMTGSDNGKVVKVGDASGSMLLKTLTHAEEPFMPKNGDKLPDAQINLFKTWISSGAPENSGSKVVAVAKKNDLTTVVAKVGRPDGPPPMPPSRLPLDPVVHTQRPGALVAMAASPWAPLVALGGQHQIVLYDTQTLDLLGILPFDAGQLNVLRFSRDGSLLLAAGGQSAKSGKALLYDVRKAKKVAEVGEEFDAVLAADIAPDHAAVAVGTPNKVLKAYNTADGKPIYTIKKHTDWVTAVAYSPDGVLLASGDRAGNLYVWEAKTGRDFYTLTGHKDAITALAFRDDGNVLASASQDGTIRLWNMEDGTQIKAQNAHGSGVTSLAFAHDGRIVTCGRDNVARVWNSEAEGQKTTEGFPDVALQCAFSDDGKRIIAGDWSGVVKVFNAADAKKVGEITADPAAPAQRLALAQQTVASLQAESDKLAAAANEAKAALDKANAALAVAQQGKGAKEVGEAMQKSAAANRAMRQATDALNNVKNTHQQKKNELARLSQEKIQLGIAMENAQKGQRRGLRQRLEQNDKQLKDAQKAQAEAEKAVKPREEELAKVTARQKEAADEMAKALAAAGPAARELPSRTQAVRAANDAMAKARTAADAASAKLAAAKGDLDRLKARIANALPAATQPSARRD